MKAKLPAICFFVASVFLIAEKTEAQPPVPKPAENQAGDDEVHKLLKARHEAAAKELKERVALSQDVRQSVAPLYDVEQRFLQSGLELRTKLEDRIAFLVDHVKLLKSLEAQFEGRVKGGAGLSADLYQARYFRLNAELQLVRARREAEKAKSK